MSVRLKFTLIFLVIASIPSFFVGVLTFTNYKKSLESIRFSQLQDLISFKAQRIEAYFSGLKASVEITQSFYNIKKNFPVMIHLAHEPVRPEFLAAKKILDGQLQNMQSVLGLSDIILASPEGKIIYSSNSKHARTYFLNFLPDPEQKAFGEGKNRIYFSDIFFNKTESGAAQMLVTAPLFDFNDVFIGVVAFEVDMAPIYSLIQDATGLGNTGETLVGKRVGHQVVFLNPLRYDVAAVLKKHIDIGEEFGGPIQEAVQGGRGIGRLTDYRGKEVIAAWRYIPSLSWGIVAKIDAEEAFADVTNLKNLVTLILALIFLLGGIAAFSLARSVSEPIKKLSKGAEIIGGGNLDYKVGTNSRDEIGQLSRSFDKMTGDLKKITASRDELNKEISERKQAEEGLRRSNENLEQFAYVASHDLQEPLRMMASYSELLERRYGGRLDGDADEFIGYIVDGAKRMQKLINDLLAYSRVGKVHKLPREIDCNAVVDKVISSLRPALEESQAAITHDELPVLMGTESHFIQLFQNLIGNGIKFHGPEAPRVHISVMKKDDEWIFSVKDNGIGIEPQYKDRIFLIFQRLHGTKEYPGTGIGLSICKKIVETEGGKIWVESELGQGANFYFTIPVKGGTKYE